jgi:hypothetical protein
MKVQKVVHIRLREPMGAMVPFCGPWGSTFKVTRCRKGRGGARHAVQCFGNRTGFTICNFEGEGGPVLGGGKEGVVADRLICCQDYGYRTPGYSPLGFDGCQLVYSSTVAYSRRL